MPPREPRRPETIVFQQVTPGARVCLLADWVGDSRVVTEARGVADPGARSGRRWDVALSFAGAQRDHVGQVAEALKALRVRCFYDADEQVRLWGTHLAEELPRIYARESAAVVVFVSADYARGDWTRLERRAAFSQAVVEAGVHVLPARFDDSELPGLLPDVVAVDLRCHTPGQFADLVVAKLADLAIQRLPPPGGSDRRPPGAVRAHDADPRLLGVHAAISVPGVRDEVPPEYVPRDADATEFGVRVKVDAAGQGGGFVVLVGGSSVGKTRCAVEAVKALLPEWWLVHPAGPAQVAALAQAPFPRMVVWLDELLFTWMASTDYRRRGARSQPPFPAVVGGSLLPDRYAAYRTMWHLGSADPPPGSATCGIGRGGPHRCGVQSGGAGSGLTAAARDPRLRVALEADGYGLTQTLAARPQLVTTRRKRQAAARTRGRCSLRRSM